MRWTHITGTVTDIEASVRFFTEVCGLYIVRDRRREGGTTVWLGPLPKKDTDPEFVVVMFQSKSVAPLDHFGFQCDSRDEVTQIAERARNNGCLVDGPTDEGGSVGYFAIVKEPGGNLVEFTYGQPLLGLPTIAIQNAA